MPGPNRESRRVRTAAQLERKRQLDRETQRLNRERNKKHMSMVESELNQLRQDFAGLSTKLERLAEFVSSCRGSAGRRPAVDKEPGSPRLVQSSLKPGNVCIDNDDDAPIDPVMVSAMTEGDPFHSDMETPGQQDLQLQIHQFQWYQNPCWSSEASNQLLTGTGFIQSLPPSLTSPSPDIPNANTKTDTQDPKTPQTEIPTTIATSGSCFCFILHQSPFECMEYRALQLLLSAHMVINQNPVAAQLYPRTPSMANLLLLDNDSNPVVNMLGQVMKRLRPPSLVDTMGVYLIMYRLFRWRVNPVLETYQDVPTWYRPSTLQQAWPHPISVDLVAWPSLREYLITQPHSIETILLGKDIREAITVDWPRDQEALIRDAHGELALNPKFEEHIYNYANWKMRRSWAKKYSHLVRLVNLMDHD